MIHQHRDEDGDVFRVHKRGESALSLQVLKGDANTSTVYASREQAERLHNALGEWLYPQNPGPTPGDYAAAVKALGDAVNGLAGSIRPLWSAPQRTATGGGVSWVPELDEPIDPEPHDVCTCPHDESSHGDIGCTAPTRLGPVQLVCRCRWRVTDPEPRDVGHPEPEPLCTRTRPADAHPVSRCTFCGHLWSDHADPTPLERVREFYRSTLSPAAVVPECGLCKQPWNDTHGQPENPCAGAPRQLVGCECGHGWGMHSESDRVGCFARHGRIDQGPVPCKCKRTRPAAHKIECDECGHRWTLHPPAFGVSYCVQSTNGVLCGCKASTP